MSHAVRVLRDARALLADPSHWTQGAIARRFPKDSRSCNPRQIDATCWCLVGAISKCSESTDTSSAPRRILAQALNIPNPAGACAVEIGWWNDKAGRTHAEVLQALDDAIAIAEKEAAA